MRKNVNATPERVAPHRGPDQYLTDLFRRERLSAGQKLALRAIARFADWGTGECFPGEARLADEMGCSTRTVRRHMRALEERGIIAARKRARERGRGSYTQVIVLVEYANGLADQQDNRCPNGPDDQQDNLDRPTGQQMSGSEEELHLRTSLPPRAPRSRKRSRRGAASGIESLSAVEASVPHSRALCEVLLEPLLARVVLKAPDPLRALTDIAAKYGSSDASVFAAAYAELGDRTHNVTAPMIGKALSKARGRHATRDCSRMHRSTINSNAKKLLRDPRIRLRVEYLRVHGAPAAKPTEPVVYRPEFAEQVRHLCRLGAVHADLLEFFKINVRTLDAWKGQHPDFLQAIEEGQALAIPLLTRATIHLNGHEGGMKRCTAKQAAFAAAWARTDFVSKAYAIAYKSKMRGEALRANGNKVAAKPQVLAAYDGHKRTLDTTARRIAESRHGITIDRIMREFAHIGFSNIMDYLHVGPGGRVFLDLGKATRDHMAAVQIVEGDVLMVPAQDVLAAARI